jgi:predicted nucleotidyltransferase
MSTLRIPFPIDQVAAFCQKWKITELAVFGSVLRSDFRPDSDIDVLVSLADDAHWSLYDWVEMQEELKGMLGRDVDLVDKKGLHNPFRRYAILTTKQVIYAA